MTGIFCECLEELGSRPTQNTWRHALEQQKGEFMESFPFPPQKKLWRRVLSRGLPSTKEMEVEVGATQKPR